MHPIPTQPCTSPSIHSVSALVWSRANSERVEGRGLQGKIGSNASYCRKLWLCRGKRLLSERHWNSSGTGQSNHRIESRLCFVSSSDQRMLITWEWAEKSWESPRCYSLAFQGKTKGVFWFYYVSLHCSTCLLYMYVFFKNVFKLQRLFFCSQHVPLTITLRMLHYISILSPFCLCARGYVPTSLILDTWVVSNFSQP